MCGRFTLHTPASRIAEVFEVIEPVDLEPRYNVAPTDPIAAVVEREGVRHLGLLRWGLVPWFMKDKKGGPPLINARSETIEQKPAFRTAFARKRCLVPADGFYEWQKDGKQRIPYLFRRADGELMALAGLWDSYQDDAGERRSSCTILTTDANSLIRGLHDRMPVVLRERDWSAWLRCEGDLAAWKDRLVPYPSEELEAVRVSQRVNSVKNDDPSILEPV